MTMRTLAILYLAACSHPVSPVTPADWTTIAHAAGITVAVEHTLYERAGAPHFFVRVRITNAGGSEIGADLRKVHEVFYPNQWGASAADHREVIDERRLVLGDFTSGATLDAFRAGALTTVAAGATLDYFEEFNASSRAEVDAQLASAPWFIISMDGQLRVADRTKAERLVPDHAEVAIHTPIPWKAIPAGAMVLDD